MSPNSENPDSPEREFDAILAQYMQHVDRGQDVDRAALIARYPQFAAELRRYFDNEDALGQFQESAPEEAPPARPGEQYFAATEPIPAQAPSPTPGRPATDSAADYNLLFGMLALEMEFVTRDQLVAAMHAWMLDKSQTLGEIFVRQQTLTAHRRKLLDDLVAEHVAQHDHDVHKSVVAVATRDELDPTLSGQYARELFATLAGPGRSAEPAADGEQTPAAEAPRVAGGRFRILEFLAQGGLGRVMAAEDVELGRTVAVKEIKPHYADDAVCQQRFVMEAEITGGLEHPGIVPVYGRGSYPDGRPYYAMRLICGDTLRAAVDRFHQQVAQAPRRPWPVVELHQLLRRFIDVCHAVQYAHSRGVIHRDLKPANVMLGKYGETLVVDWGLAKVVGRADAVKDPAEQTLRLRSVSGSGATELGSTVGTPAFMSPEQAAGDVEQIGPASDVYGLGATLYYLLTGQVPFTDKTTLDVLEKVKRGEFPRPRQVRSSVPAPLEAICLKAMALSASDRYPVAAGLIEDLERWIADEPVSAYAETRSERLARWMRRHRTGVQAAAVILLSAAVISSAAMLVVTRAWRNEKTAREAEVVRFRQAREAVDRWVTGPGLELQYFPGAQRARSRMLELAAAAYEEFVRTSSEDHDLESERGRTYLRLGHLRLSLDDAQGAKQAYETAQQVFVLAAQRQPDDPVCQVELADCRINLGLVALRTYDYKAAQQEYDASIAQLEEVLRRSAADARAQGSLATALLNRGELLGVFEQFDAAERDLRRAIDVATQLGNQQAETTGPLASVASAKALLGRVLYSRGQYAQGLQALNEAVADADKLVEVAVGKPQYFEKRAATRVELGQLLGHLGRWREEAEAYRLAVDDYQKLADLLPGAPSFVENRALTQIDLAALWQRLGQLSLVEDALTEADTALQSLLDKDANSESLLERRAFCRDIAGEILRDRGKGAESKQALSQALQANERLIAAARDAGAPVVPQRLESAAVYRSHLAQTLYLLNELPQAEQEFRTAIEALNEILRSTSERLPLTRHRLAFVHQYFGSLLAAQGKPEEALQQWTAAQQLWTELAAAPDAAAEHRYALACFLANGPAVKLWDGERAAILAKGLTADAPGNAAYWSCLGAALCRTERWQDAREALNQAIQLRSQDRQDDGRDWFWLAVVHWHTDDQAGAREAYRRAAKWREETMPGNADALRLQQEVAALLGETP